MDITGYLLSVNATCAATTLKNIEHFQNKGNHLAASLAIIQLFIEKVADTAIHLLAVVPTITFTAVQLFLYPIFGGTSPLAGLIQAFAHVAYAIKSLAAATLVTPLALVQPTLVSTSYQWLSLYPHKASVTSRISSALSKAWVFAQANPTLVIGGSLATLGLLGGIAIASRKVTPMPEKIIDDTLDQGTSLNPNPIRRFWDNPFPNPAAPAPAPVCPLQGASLNPNPIRRFWDNPFPNPAAQPLPQPVVPLKGNQQPLPNRQLVCSLQETNTAAHTASGFTFVGTSYFANAATSGQGIQSQGDVSETALTETNEEAFPISPINEWMASAKQGVDSMIQNADWATQRVWQAMPSRESMETAIVDSGMIGTASLSWMAISRMVTGKASWLEKLINRLGLLCKNP